MAEATSAIDRVAGKILTLADIELETARALNSEYLRHHPEEVAAFLNERSPEDTALLLARAPTPIAAAQILERLNPRVAADVLALLDDVLVRAILAVTNPSKAAPIIGGLDPSAREAQLARLDERVAEQIREMLAYPADSAGALMDPRISAFGPDTTVEGALRKMRTFKEKELGSIYLMDATGRLAGAVPLGEIATAEPETQLRDLIRGEPISVFVNASREEVVKALDERRVATLPVVDADSKLVGVIRYRQLVAAAEAEATMGMQTMVGVGKEERALSRVGFAVRQRLPWLEINLATAFAAAFVVGLFEGTIARFTALAVLMPVVAGQSGNSGMQALAVTMRGLALREIRPTHWPRLIWKEAGTGIINGVACAAVTAIAVYVWSQSAGLAFVIGAAMVISMSVAGMSGAAVPLVLKTLRQDPAQSSSIVLTTITDIAGFMTFLGLASIFASLLE
ncbi:MAG TPA: magnesium transporter [Candidatus Limnocylindria bacterium]|nr:magnesium transporter [Candidatus Limnocylindria bacterium]